MEIYVGNLSYDLSEQELQEAFEAFGEVTSVRIIKDRDSGRSKGFAFVEMPSQSEAEAAIAGLNGKEVKGRTVTANQAKGRAEGARVGSGGRSQGYGGGGRGGYSGGGRHY